VFVAQTARGDSESDDTMSVRVLSLVWEGYPGDSSVELLALLALADWSDDEGRSFPSIAAISRKCRIKSRQSQRLIHRLIDVGLVSVTENAHGGKPGSSRRYRINLDLLTGVKNDRGVKNDADGCHLRRERGGQNDTLYVSDTSITVKEVAQALPASSKKSKSGTTTITLKVFLEDCQANGIKPIPDDDPVLDYAKKVGIDHDMLLIGWKEFKAAFLSTEKRQKDWRAHFRNSVRRNWYKLWFLKEGESAQWTTAGEQARRAAA
jgi:hypothetical protein